MNIIVCIKQVPDTTEIKIDPVKGTLIREGVPSIMNPDDKGGLELALRLKDQFGAKVTVVSMGPPQADVIMREAFAMGADRAILLSDRKFAGSDTLATSYAIAGLCRSLDYDLIIAAVRPSMATPHKWVPKWPNTSVCPRSPTFAMPSCSTTATCWSTRRTKTASKSSKWKASAC